MIITHSHTITITLEDIKEWLEWKGLSGEEITGIILGSQLPSSPTNAGGYIEATKAPVIRLSCAQNQSTL